MEHITGVELSNPETTEKKEKRAFLENPIPISSPRFVANWSRAGKREQMNPTLGPPQGNRAQLCSVTNPVIKAKRMRKLYFIVICLGAALPSDKRKAVQMNKKSV